MKVKIYGISVTGKLHVEYFGETSYEDIERAYISMNDFLVNQNLKANEPNVDIMPFEGVISASRISHVYRSNDIIAEIYISPQSGFNSDLLFQIVLASATKSLDGLIERTEQRLRIIVPITKKDLGAHEVPEDFSLNNFKNTKELLDYFKVS